MQPNLRFIAYGAIIAFVFLTIISPLADLSRLVIVICLCTVFVVIEKSAPKS